jgi:hypothetical protein
LDVKLFVCYGTFGVPTAERHPCARAYKALTAAGHDAQVIRTFGCAGTDRFWPGRREVKHLTGTYEVPTLVLSNGTIIDGSEHIVAWAAANPAAVSTAGQQPTATATLKA